MKKESRSQEKEIRIDLNYLKDLTKKMVKIPSPPGREKEVALFIASELEKIGIKGGN